eukprot:COSAG05_NODE_1395_length_4993_cov_6.265836_6_plen_94_part_00
MWCVVDGAQVDESGEVPRANFDTFLGGFTAVFQVATRENWHVLLYAGMRSQAGAGASVLFYVSLIIVTNYILLALFIGTLLQQVRTLAFLSYT